MSDRQVPTSCETLGKSAALSFAICKMGTIILGSDEVVIKCLCDARCAERALFTNTRRKGDTPPAGDDPPAARARSFSPQPSSGGGTGGGVAGWQGLLAPSQTCCVALGKTLPASESQFPHLKLVW